MSSFSLAEEKKKRVEKIFSLIFVCFHSEIGVQWELIKTIPHFALLRRRNRNGGKIFPPSHRFSLPVFAQRQIIYHFYSIRGLCSVFRLFFVFRADLSLIGADGAAETKGKARFSPLFFRWNWKKSGKGGKDCQFEFKSLNIDREERNGICSEKQFNVSNMKRSSEAVFSFSPPCNLISQFERF